MMEKQMKVVSNFGSIYHTSGSPRLKSCRRPMMDLIHFCCPDADSDCVMVERM